MEVLWINDAKAQCIMQSFLQEAVEMYAGQDRVVDPLWGPLHRRNDAQPHEYTDEKVSTRREARKSRRRSP